MNGDLLPPSATNAERAVSLACGPVINHPIRKLWSPQECPAEILPWLASALSVDDWDGSWPEPIKRQAIAESVALHRRKGTPGALRRALQRLGYEVEIDTNTGEAYVFRLRFKLSAGQSAGGVTLTDAINKATNIALRQKNVRSSLGGIDLLADTDPAVLHIGAATITGLETEIQPE